MRLKDRFLLEDASGPQGGRGPNFNWEHSKHGVTCSTTLNLGEAFDGGGEILEKAP